MGKSKNERNKELLYRYFKRTDNASKKEIERLLLNEDSAELENR